MSHVSLKPSPLELRVAALGGEVVPSTLVAVGESLRRAPSPSDARLDESRRALLALEVPSVARALREVDVGLVERELERSRQEAFEAAMTEDVEERTLFRESALSGLLARDRVESMAHAAIEFALRLFDGGEDLTMIESEVNALRDRLATVDRIGLQRRRELTPLNPLRRAELEKLDPSERSAAWWFEAMSGADYDELVSSLGGAGSSEDPSAALSAELERSRIPSLDTLVSGAIARARLRSGAIEEGEWLASARLPGLEMARRLLRDPVEDKAE